MFWVAGCEAVDQYAGTGLGWEAKTLSGRDRTLDPTALESEIRAAALAALAPYVGIDAQEYCGYALYSDADAMTVCCSVNTRSHRDRLQAEYPADREYFEWTPAEWALEGIGHDHFDALCRRLLAASLNSEGIDLVEHRAVVFEACVAALEWLVREGFFGTDNTQVVVFAVSDYDDPGSETAWIRRLNPPDKAEGFARWLSTTSTDIE